MERPKVEFDSPLMPAFATDHADPDVAGACRDLEGTPSPSPEIDRTSSGTFRQGEGRAVSYDTSILRLSLEKSARSHPTMSLRGRCAGVWMMSPIRPKQLRRDEVSPYAIALVGRMRIPPGRLGMCTREALALVPKRSFNADWEIAAFGVVALEPDAPASARFDHGTGLSPVRWPTGFAIPAPARSSLTRARDAKTRDRFLRGPAARCDVGRWHVNTLFEDDVVSRDSRVDSNRNPPH